MTPHPIEVRRALRRLTGEGKNIGITIANQLAAREQAITAQGRKVIDAAIEKNVKRLAGISTG